MILNLLVVAFVLGMGVLWATYGLFSALIHLALAVVAGAIAFAVWEPVTVNLLLPYIPHYAWAVGLVLPFAVTLLALRIAADKLVTGNMKFPGLVDQVLGGAVGAVSGVVSAGVLLIGLSFLPMPLSFLGFQPYEVKANGTVGVYEGTDQAATLWIPADRLVADFYGELSRRGFSSGRPLAEVHPDVLAFAGTFRLGRFYDPHASLVAIPGALSVGATVRYEGELPEGLDADVAQWLSSDAFTRKGEQIVAVDTTWTNEPKGVGAFDSDNLLRVPPYQARLVARVDGRLERFLPVGWSKPSQVVAGREFYKVETNQSMASALLSPAIIGFVYAIPEGAEPAYIDLRGVRMSLPGEVTTGDGEALAEAVGVPAGTVVVEDTGPVSNPAAAEAVGEKQGGFANHRPVELEQTAALPSPVSPNEATGLNVQDGFVVGGKDRSPRGRAGGASARDLGIPASLRPIRLKLEPLSAAGQVLGGGSTEANIWLEAQNGNRFNAVAYAWMAGTDQEISVQAVERTTDLPLNAYKDGDTLYLYFQVPPGVPLAKYHVGDQTYFEINWTVDPDLGLPRQRRR